MTSFGDNTGGGSNPSGNGTGGGGGFSSTTFNEASRSNNDDEKIRIFPNPFSETTNLVIELDDFVETDEPIILKIINPSGKIIREITIGTPQGNIIQYNWDGKDASGKEVTKGVYYFECKINDTSFEGKVIKM